MRIILGSKSFGRRYVLEKAGYKFEVMVKEGKVMHTAGGFMVENPLLKPYVERIEKVCPG